MTKLLKNDATKSTEHDPFSRVVIGGPGTSLPFFVESFLSWSMVVPHLAFHGYNYLTSIYLIPRMIQMKRHLQHIRFLLPKRANESIACGTDTNENMEIYMLLDNWLPLTTTSYNEVHRLSPLQRHDQLLKLLCHLGINHDDEEKLISCIRSNEACRRLATLMMKPYFRETNSKLCRRSMTNLGLENPDLVLPKKLASCWSKLLELPKPSCNKDDGEFSPKISLILPAYGEKGVDVARKIERARCNCVSPHEVEVIVVDAGRCVDLTEEISRSEGYVKRIWGKVIFMKFTSGGGRGPCLNFGGNSASGEILTFCHSDTILPSGWDSSIISTLKLPFTKNENSLNRSVPNSCAFSLGIDTFGSSEEHYYPPGLKAVEKTIHLRSKIFSLPYGDQVLSIPAHIFRHLGGFPDQCLMEDYELMGLLRRRSALLSAFNCFDNEGNLCKTREEVAIIGGEPAMCAARRWQKFGVLYVTYTNFKIVRLHEGGLSSDSLYKLYYGGFVPKRNIELAPWEHDLVKIFA